MTDVMDDTRYPVAYYILDVDSVLIHAWSVDLDAWHVHMGADCAVRV